MTSTAVIQVETASRGGNKGNTAPQADIVDTHTPARPLDQQPAAVYVASLADGSRRTMSAALNAIAGMLTNGTADALAIPWGALQFQHTAAIRAQLAEKYSAATANKMLSALRGALKAARDLGQMDSDQYTRAANLKAIQGETLPKGRALAGGEIAALMEACSQDPTADGARDAAIIAIMRAGGLRRAEVCALHLSDLNPTEAGTALHVQGKRNKQREIPLAQGALDAVNDWLAIRGTAPGALFHPITKGGTIERRPMTPQALYDVLTKRAREAKIKNLSPHDFRRTFVSDLLDKGADIATVQKLAGHATVNTTARYDRRGEAAKRKAVDLLHVPYRRREARAT